MKYKMETCLYLNKSNQTPKSQIQTIVTHTLIKQTNAQKCIFQSTNKTKSNPNTNSRLQIQNKQSHQHIATHITQKLKRVSSNHHFNFQPLPNLTQVRKSPIFVPIQQNPNSQISKTKQP